MCITWYAQVLVVVLTTGAWNWPSGAGSGRSSSSHPSSPSPSSCSSSPSKSSNGMLNGVALVVVGAGGMAGGRDGGGGGACGGGTDVGTGPACTVMLVGMNLTSCLTLLSSCLENKSGVHVCCPCCTPPSTPQWLRHPAWSLRWCVPRCAAPIWVCAPGLASLCRDVCVV